MIMTIKSGNSIVMATVGVVAVAVASTSTSQRWSMITGTIDHATAITTITITTAVSVAAAATTITTTTTTTTTTTPTLTPTTAATITTATTTTTVTRKLFLSKVTIQAASESWPGQSQVYIVEGTGLTAVTAVIDRARTTMTMHSTVRDAPEVVMRCRNGKVSQRAKTL
mmetsp:Transcript_19576/g.28753  ORF Transcript_19576/g.28753 Transcript_19576/m.28753 type:complete len:169 (-) Transcript_19576:708-1214(-)